MNNQTIVCCVVALLLGMLLANMLKSVCGCKLVEGALSCDEAKNIQPMSPGDPCRDEDGLGAWFACHNDPNRGGLGGVDCDRAARSNGPPAVGGFVRALRAGDTGFNNNNNSQSNNNSP